MSFLRPRSSHLTPLHFLFPLRRRLAGGSYFFHSSHFLRETLLGFIALPVLTLNATYRISHSFLPQMHHKQCMHLLPVPPLLNSS